jgi:hypothetical protein
MLYGAAAPADCGEKTQEEGGLQNCSGTGRLVKKQERGR